MSEKKCSRCGNALAYHTDAQCNDALFAKVCRLEKELQRIKDDLAAGYHHPKCESLLGEQYACTCGWGDVLEAHKQVTCTDDLVKRGDQT